MSESTSGSLQGSLNTQGSSPLRYHKSGSISFNSLNWSATRNSSSDKGVLFKFSGEMNFGSVSGSHYDYMMEINVYVNSTHIGGWSVGRTSGIQTKPLSEISKTVDVDSSSCTITITGHCPESGSCSFGSYSNHTRTDSFTILVPNYNASTPATNASNGKIFSTNHTSGSQGGNISDKPDLEVWWTWTGATAGTPDSVNGIKQYNIDISNTNNVNNASSITETQNYTKNKHISLFTLCRSYNVKVGGTLYCWVNTQIKSGAWLRKSIFRFNYNEKRWFYKI